MAKLPPPLDSDELPPLPASKGSSSRPPPLEPRRPRQRPRPSRRRWLAVPIGLAVYLLLALVTTVQPVSVAGLSLTAPVPGLSPARMFGLPDRPFVVMIAGLDIRPAQDGPSRADSILLLRIDPDKNRAAFLSIPRDSMMQLPGPGGELTRDRVNAAYSYNWSRDDPARAPAALAQTIEHNLGIKVDYYVIFDWQGATELIDEAGGVTVMVHRTLRDDTYNDDDATIRPQLFEKGIQHLDGYRAVAYGRIRKGSDDLDRIRRQQQVAEALLRQLSSPSSLGRIWGVWSAYKDAVETDLSLRQSAGVFVQLKRIGTGRILTHSLGDATVSCSRCAGALLLLRPDETARIISEAFADDSAGERAAELLITAGVTP
jgi:LCP family protein required for cell wall assembly